MALLWIEGFEGFGAGPGNPSPAGIVLGKYTSAQDEAHMHVMPGRLGGYALQFRYDNTCRIWPSDLTTDPTMIVGCALKWDVIPTGAATYPRFLSFVDVGTLGMNLRVASTGELEVYRGATLLATSTGAGIVYGAWFYLEFKVVCNATTGSYEVRVNGVNVLSASGVNTKAGTHNYHTSFLVSGTGTANDRAVTVDDLYCCDGSGSLNNNFLGPRKVLAIFPDSAGDSTQWTPNSGDNYAAVDEQAADNDTSYVEVASTGQKDLYNYGALGETVAGISGIQVTTLARVTDATPFDLYQRVKSGSTEVSGSVVAVGSTSYVSKTEVFETDPNTSAAWSQANLEAAQFGILS